MSAYKEFFPDGLAEDDKEAVEQYTRLLCALVDGIRGLCLIGHRQIEIQEQTLQFNREASAKELELQELSEERRSRQFDMSLGDFAKIQQEMLKPPPNPPWHNQATGDSIALPSEASEPCIECNHPRMAHFTGNCNAARVVDGNLSPCNCLAFKEAHSA